MPGEGQAGFSGTPLPLQERMLFTWQVQCKRESKGTETLPMLASQAEVARGGPPGGDKARFDSRESLLLQRQGR